MMSQLHTMPCLAQHRITKIQSVKTVLSFNTEYCDHHVDCIRVTTASILFYAFAGKMCGYKEGAARCTGGEIKIPLVRHISRRRRDHLICLYGCPVSE